MPEETITTPLKQKSVTFDNLNLSKGFKYQSQDISSYENLKPTTTDLDKEVEKNLKVTLPTGKLDEVEEEKFIRGLDEDGMLALSNLISQGYSYNAAKALYENRDNYNDITAQGIAKYQKKPFEMPSRIAPTAIGVGGVAGLDAATYYRGKLLSSVGRSVYEQTFDPSINETRAKQNILAGEKGADDAVVKAETNLANARKSGVGIEEAEKALADAKNAQSVAKGKVANFRGMADTAYDYNIGGGLFKGWTPTSRGVDARTKANKIFTDTINPALENSKSTLNIQDMIEGLSEDIVSLAKNDPDRLSEYQDALEALKGSYSDPKYASMSLKDAQDLKSGLQGRTPQKFFKGKNSAEREITNAYEELRGVLSNKIKEGLHSKLTEELGQDTAKLYRDYSNLIEYADKQARAATKGGFKGGAGGFISSAYESLGEPAVRKLSLLTAKKGDFLQRAASIPKNVWNWMAKNGEKTVNTLKGKMSVKNLSKSMKAGVFDPIGLIELGELMPGSIGDAFKQAAQIPGVSVDEMMYEIENYKSEWDNMSDDERIMQIMEEYNSYGDDTISEEDARASYERWLKDNPDGKLKDINSIEIVKSV